MEDMMQLAESLGLTVIEKRGRHLAGYRPSDQSIRVTPNLPRRTVRALLAHEIAHHVLGHLPTDFGPLRARQEREANEWAASTLIAEWAYEEVEHLRDGHVPSMAFDLDVSPELVLAYQGMLARDRAFR